MLELIFYICHKESADTGDCVAILLWQLWAARNDVVWNSSRDTPLGIGRLALSNWQQWKLAQEMNRPGRSATPPLPTQIRWEKSNHGWLKCNVDIAFHSSEGISTTDCCFRNAEGVFVAGYSTWKSTHITVLEGEAIALQEAIQVAIAKGWDKVVFETDSRTLVDQISDRSSGISEFNVIVSSIKSMLALFSNFEVKFVMRQANMATHTIARAACSWPSRHVFEICPPRIESFLINDIS